MVEINDSVGQALDAPAVPEHLSEVLEQVRRESVRIVIVQDGLPVAGIVPARDLERLAVLDAQREERLRILRESQAAFAGEPPEKVEAEIKKAIAAVRRENR